MDHACALIGAVFGGALGPARVDIARQGHFAAGHLDDDVRRIQRIVVAQPVADVFLDALVRPYITLRSLPSERSSRSARLLGPRLGGNVAADPVVPLWPVGPCRARQFTVGPTTVSGVRPPAGASGITLGIVETALGLAKPALFPAAQGIAGISPRKVKGMAATVVIALVAGAVVAAVAIPSANILFLTFVEATAQVTRLVILEPTAAQSLPIVTLVTMGRITSIVASIRHGGLLC